MSSRSNAASGPQGQGASPKAAAAFGAGIVYVWAEGIIRIWFSKGGDATLRLWAPRAGDIAAMWLAMVVVALVAYVGFAAAWSKRTSVGSITMWTIVLVISAIVAPLLGEWGQALGI